MNLPAGDGNTASNESLGAELANALNLGDMVGTANRGGQAAATQPAQAPESDEPPPDPTNTGEEDLDAAQDALEDDSGDTPPEGEEEDGQEIRKFTDLTAMFPEEEGITAEDLYGLEIGSGKDGTVFTVGDLKDLMQNREAFEAEKAQFAQDRERQAKELEEARQQAQVQTGEFQQLPQEIREAEAAILAIRQQAQSYDWKRAEEEDPGEAALLRQKFRDAHDAAAGRHQQLMQEYGHKRQKAYGDFVASQREKMFQRIPEWRDDKVLVKEREGIDKLVAAYGYTREEMDAVVDPRFSQLLRDYMLLKAKFDGAVEHTNKVRRRGNKVLRTTFRGKPKARLQQQKEQDARRPEASRQEKHQAIKDILSEAPGFL